MEEKTNNSELIRVFQEEEAVNQMRRSHQLRGMGNSTAGLRGEAAVRGRASDSRMSLLGQLMNQERTRDNDYTRLRAAGNYGGMERNVAAGQANLAQSMLNYQPWYQPQFRMDPSEYSRTNNAVEGISNWGSKVTDLIALSDRRLKTDVVPISGPFEVNGCRWYRWVWDDAASSFGLSGASFGLIAQEVQDKYPEAVSQNSHGYLMINYKTLLEQIGE